MLSDTPNESVLSAASYLLAIVIPSIQSAVLRMKYNDVSQVLLGLLELQPENSLTVRSMIHCLELLLRAQDGGSWSDNKECCCQSVHKTLLALAVDHRPKVRKAASDAVLRIVKTVPPPSTFHPATAASIDFCRLLLEDFVQSMPKASRLKERSESEHSARLCLVLLSFLMPVFVAHASNDKIQQKLVLLCPVLLSMPLQSSGANTVLTQCVLQVFNALFGGKAEESTLQIPLIRSVMKRLLELSPSEKDAVFTPLWLDLLSNGFQCLASAVLKFVPQDGLHQDEEVVSYCNIEYPLLVSNTFNRLFSSYYSSTTCKPAVLQRATILLSLLSNEAVSSVMVNASCVKEDTQSPLQEMLHTLNESLQNVHFRDSWGYILLVVSTFVQRVGPVAPTLLFETVRRVFAFRDDPAYNERFPFKDEVDRVIYAIIQTLGLQTFVSVVPLNIENESPGEARRPYLISAIHSALQQQFVPSGWIQSKLFGPHEMKFFLTYMMPLSNRLLEKAGNLSVEGKTLEAKLFETLGSQIISLLPLICSSVPPDMDSCFAKLAPHIGQVLQTLPQDKFPNLSSPPDFRPIVCESLQTVIDTHLAICNLQKQVALEEESTDTVLTEASATAERVLNTIKTFSNKFLTTLCNNYTTINIATIEIASEKGQALQVLHEKEIQHYERTIKSFLSISEKPLIQEYFMSLIQNYLQMQTELNTKNADGDGASGERVPVERIRLYTIMDLMLILLPYLPQEHNESPESAAQVFLQVLCGQLQESDPTMQKKTYKALLQLIQMLPADSFPQNELLAQLFTADMISKAAPGAKRARVRLIQYLCETLVEKPVLLQVIPTALPEVILATKESNEKARDAAYACLVSFANQMRLNCQTADEVSAKQQQAVVKPLERALDDDDMEADESPVDYQAEISLREYMLMVVAGLAGTTAHMQSASISSLGRLIFEFVDVLEKSMIQEIVKTVLIVMKSKNREIIKSALGFIKVVIICLPQEYLEDVLEGLIISILEHSRDHKSHFKAKVRHIFERLIRKFSYEAIEGFVPEEDRKLVVNIRKRRERLKKQKASMSKDEKNATEPNKPLKYDEALHESDSDLDSDADDKDEAYIPEQFRENRRVAAQDGHILNDDEDEVVDFMDASIVSKIGTGLSKKAKGSKNSFKTSDEGRLILDEDSDAQMDVDNQQQDYYKQSLESEATVVRKPDGRIKFKHNQQQQSKNETEDKREKNVGARWDKSNAARQGKKKSNQLDESTVNRMLGRQFRSKTARGDVKRPGQAEPHAYIPLSSKVVGNKKKSTKLNDQFKNILKAVQSGSEVGSVKKKTHFNRINKSNKKHNK